MLNLTNIWIHPSTVHTLTNSLRIYFFPLRRADLFFSGFAVELAGYVWTVDASGKKTLRIRKNPDSCGRGLNLVISCYCCKGRQRNEQWFITHVRSYCFAHWTVCSVTFSLSPPSWFAQAPEGPGKTPFFTWAESNANEKNPLFSLLSFISIRSGSCETVFDPGLRPMSWIECKWEMQMRKPLCSLSLAFDSAFDPGLTMWFSWETSGNNSREK